MKRNGLSFLLDRLINSYPKDVDFVLASVPPIPTLVESETVYAIADATPVSQGDVESARQIIDFNKAYLLRSFSVRSAILAVKTHFSEAVGVSALCLVIDNCLIDWRDLIVALSLVEACAHMLNIDFECVARNLIDFAAPLRKETIVVYFSRAQEVRCPDVMGYAVSGCGEEFGFTRVA